MMKMSMKWIPLFLCLIVLGLAIGCSNGQSDSANTNNPANPMNTDERDNQQKNNQQENNQGAEQPPLQMEPVTLKIMYYSTLVAREAIEQFIVNPVKQKYPYITIQPMDPASLPDLLAARRSDDIPDIVITDYSNLSTVIDLRYPADLNDTLKKLNVDLSKMVDSPLEGVRALSDKGELLGLPIYLDKYMLFYNVDLFEKFAVPYPSDEMTFEELVALVKRMTRQDGDVQYLGYRWADLYTFGYQLGLPVISETTGKAALQTDEWKYALSLMKDIIDAGNHGNDKVTHDHFFKEQRLSIYPQWMAPALSLLEAAPDLNWDMAAMPYSKYTPKVSGPAKPIYLIASTISKNVEQAITAIAHVATSAEAQTLLSQYGRITVLQDESIREQLGTEMSILAGKNVAAVFKYPFGKLPYTTAYESQAWAGLDTAPPNVIQGMDVNTALRLAEEEANKAIEAYLSSQK